MTCWVLGDSGGFPGFRWFVGFWGIGGLLGFGLWILLVLVGGDLVKLGSVHLVSWVCSLLVLGFACLCVSFLLEG